MKKLLAILLSAALLLATFCMVACNNEGEPKKTSTTTTSGKPQTPPPPAEPDMTPGSVDNPVYMGDGPLSVTVEPGKVFHIAVKNPGGQKITIEDANASVLYSDTLYEAVDGVLTLELVATAGDGRKAAILGISTKSEASSTFEVHIEARLGSMGNPIVLESLEDLHVAVQKDAFIYYQWTTTENGNFSVDCENVKSNIVLNVGHRTTGESNGATTSQIGLEKGETVVIAVGTIGTATVDGGVDLLFAFEEVNPAADFRYTVSVEALGMGGIAGVTVEIYNHANDELVVSLVTDESGSATHAGIWADCYAKITLPLGYTVVSDNDEDPTNDILSEFHLKSGLFGGANAVFTLVADEIEDEE